MDGHIVGIVEVPVTHLRFRRDLPARAFDQNIQRYLEPILEHDVQHSDPRNHIAGIIDEEEYLQVLQELGLTGTELRDTIRGGPYPILRNHIIEHGDGQHRIAAAKSVCGNAIWTVALHKFTNKSSEYLSQVGYVKRRTQHCTYETRHSDGEIYLNIRHSRVTMQTEEESKWRKLLKKGKRIAVDMIFERPGICEALDKLRAFQGLWTGMQLGNWHRHLALDCDWEMQNYFEMIYSVLSWFVLEDMNMFPATDIETMRTIEGRAPYACAEDRDLIEEAFQSRKIYSKIVEPERRALVLERILSYRGIIPSMRTFHENMKYFSTAVRIIRKLLLPHEFRLWRNGLPSRRRRRLTSEGDPLPSLHDALKKRWDKEAMPFIEVSEGEFRSAFGQPSFQSVYIQLFLAALRQFPYLNDQWRPRIDQGEEVTPVTDPDCTSLFCSRADLLGIQGFLAYREAAPNSLPMLVDVESGAELVRPVDRRWGLPHTRNFRVIQQAAFLPTLLDDGASSQMCVAFVLREFITAFMGPNWKVSNGIDWGGRKISLANPPSQPGTVLQVEDFEVDEGESTEVVQAIDRSGHNGTREGQEGRQFPGLPSPMSDIDMLEQSPTAAVIEDMVMVDAPDSRHQPPERLESFSSYENSQRSSHSHGASYYNSIPLSPYRICSPFAVDSDDTALAGSVNTEGNDSQWYDVSGSNTLRNSWATSEERDKIVNYWNDAGWHRSFGGSQLPDRSSSSMKRISSRGDPRGRAADVWTCSSSTEPYEGRSDLHTFDRVHRWGKDMANGRSSVWSTSLPGTSPPISVGRPAWGTDTSASISARSIGSGSMRGTHGRLTPLGPSRYSNLSSEDDYRLGVTSSLREPLPSLPTDSHGSFFPPCTPHWVPHQRNSVSQASIDVQSDFSTVPLTPPSARALRRRRGENRSSSVVSPVSHWSRSSAPQSIAWSLPSASDLYHPSQASLHSHSGFVMGSPSTESSVHERW